MRQAEEDHVVPGEHVEVGRLEHPVGERHQVRLEAAERLAGVAAAGERPDLHPGVPQEEAEHLTPGVPAGSGHRHTCRHVHDHTPDCMVM